MNQWTTDRNVRRIVALNVRGGGGTRVDRLCRYLDTHDPHTVVITEWRDNATGRLFEAWAKAQAMHHVGLADGGTANGVFIASRAEFLAESVTPVGCGAGTLMQARFAEFTILGCYFPQLEEKAVFFDRCSQVIATHRGKPLALIGDLNTGSQITDRSEKGVRYSCAEGFDRLCRLDGLIDLWRNTHTDAREWSWLSNRGNGFRIDHALANAEFLERSVPVCTYDHSTRTTGLTDHSALIVEIKAEAD